MKVCRNLVFETNSSSSHSISLKKVDSNAVQIPRNVKDYDICKEAELLYDMDSVTELAKCRYMYSLVGMYIMQNIVSEETTPVLYSHIYSCFRTAELAQPAFEACKEELLKIDWLVWLNEVVERKTGTNVVLSCQYSEAPFFTEYFSCEDYNALDILEVKNGMENDKEYMQNLFEKVIFGNYIIRDVEEEW